MNYKKLGIGILSVLLVSGSVWYFMISSYEEDLGTNNEFYVVDSSSNLTSERNNSLFDISFSKSDESLEWSKLTISIDNGTERMDCSKGNFTSNDIGKSKVNDYYDVNLKYDRLKELGFIKAHVSIFNNEVSSKKYSNFRFSKTDIFLSDNVTGTIIEGKNFEEVSLVPDQDFTEDSSERLDWYDYKISTHRIEPEDKIYVINNGGQFFKIKFLSYYNDNDDPRHISFLVAALEGSDFPALSNPLLVSPAKCTIIESSLNSDFWEQDEQIMIYENDFDICSDACTIKIFITYENISVKGTQQINLL